jgi:hypothetical protein
VNRGFRGAGLPPLRQAGRPPLRLQGSSFDNTHSRRSVIPIFLHEIFFVRRHVGVEIAVAATASVDRSGGAGHHGSLGGSRTEHPVAFGAGLRGHQFHRVDQSWPAWGSCRAGGELPVPGGCARLGRGVVDGDASSHRWAAQPVQHAVPGLGGVVGDRADACVDMGDRRVVVRGVRLVVSGTRGSGARRRSGLRGGTEPAVGDSSAGHDRGLRG